MKTLDKRKILLENLQDEEKDGADHPKLWKNFAIAMGSNDKKIQFMSEKEKFTTDMIDNFFQK